MEAIIMTKKVIITYKGNGGKGSSYVQKVDPNTAIKLKPNKFKRPGYVFISWSTSKNGKKKYSTSKKYKIKDDITLYAIWKQLTLADAAKLVYTKIYKNKLPHRQRRRLKLATRLKNIKRGYSITCNASASISLQQILCLKPGKLVRHTKSNKKAKGRNISTYMKGKANLINCNVYYVNKTFKRLPKKYKPKTGAVYIYDSNAATYSGDGKHIWSCNNIIYYTKKGDVFKKSGYCFTSPIKIVILPRY